MPGSVNNERARMSADDLPQAAPPMVPTMEAYNAVVETANLNSVILTASEFEMSPEFLDPATPRNLDLNLREFGVAFQPDQGVAQGTFTWEITGKRVSDGQTLLRIKASFMALYVDLQGRDKAAVDAFVERVGKFAVFPYFRQHVAHLSWAAHANLPVVPVLRDQKPTPSDRPPPPDGDPGEE